MSKLVNGAFPKFFETAAKRVDEWVAGHPGKPFPVPERVRRGAMAGLLMRYLELRGVEICDGDIPEEIRGERAETSCPGPQ